MCIEEAVDGSVFSDQNLCVATNLVSAITTVLIVFEVDAGAGPVVLGAAVNGFGRAEHAFIVGGHARFEVVVAAACELSQHGAEVVGRIAADQ